jgi:hypothetical protein
MLAMPYGVRIWVAFVRLAARSQNDTPMGAMNHAPKRRHKGRRSATLAIQLSESGKHAKTPPNAFHGCRLPLARDQVRATRKLVGR